MAIVKTTVDQSCRFLVRRSYPLSRLDYLFTSESVAEGHPDKVCDRISDEIVDLFYREAAKVGMDPSIVRVACDTFATTNRVLIAGESRGGGSVNLGKVESADRR